MSEDNRTRYHLKSPTMSLTVTVKDIGYGRRIVTGILDPATNQFVGLDLDKLLDYMTEKGQVEMTEI